MPKILIFVAFKLVILVRNIEHFCHGHWVRFTGSPRQYLHTFTVILKDKNARAIRVKFLDKFKVKIDYFKVIIFHS